MHLHFVALHFVLLNLGPSLVNMRLYVLALRFVVSIAARR